MARKCLYLPNVIESCLGGAMIVSAFAVALGIVGLVLMGMFYMIKSISFTSQGLAIALLLMIIIGVIVIFLAVLGRDLVIKCRY
jgi:hypothetical protein